MSGERYTAVHDLKGTIRSEACASTDGRQASFINQVMLDLISARLNILSGDAYSQLICQLRHIGIRLVAADVTDSDEAFKVSGSSSLARGVWLRNDIL